MYFVNNRSILFLSSLFFSISFFHRRILNDFVIRFPNLDNKKDSRDVQVSFIDCEFSSRQLPESKSLGPGSCGHNVASERCIVGRAWLLVGSSTPRAFAGTSQLASMRMRADWRCLSVSMVTHCRR